jgi:hypothetical protein
MSKPIRSEERYPASIDEVWQTMTDREFITAKYQALNHENLKILELTETPDGGFRISTQRDAEAAGLPDVAKKVFGSRQTITQTEEWGPPGADGSRTAKWTLLTKGAPAKAGGTATLKPDGDGTVALITGEVKVSVPLVGGKIEGSAKEVIEEQMHKEAEFSREWAAGKR